MKTFLLLSLLVAGTCAGADPSINGKWQLHTSISGNESDMVCTFAAKDDSLTGDCSGERGKFEISGKVSGNKVTFSYKTEYNGTPLTVKYDGALSAGSVKGNVEVPEFAVAGDFTATPAK